MKSTLKQYFNICQTVNSWFAYFLFHSCVCLYIYIELYIYRFVYISVCVVALTLAFVKSISEIIVSATRL